MKKPKTKKIIFRAGVLVLAFALLALCFPANALLAFAANYDSTDLSFMTISSDTSTGAIEKVVNRGATYKIPKAYIGGEILIDGTTGISENESLVSSSVTVRYGGAGKDLLNGDSTEESFVAERVGKYVITYSYVYKADVGEGEQQFTNSYDLEIECVLSDVAFNFADNNVVMPSKIDLNVKGAEIDATDAANVTENRDEANKGKKTYRDVEISLPEIKDEDGNVVEDVKFATTAPADAEKYVIISVTGGNNAPKTEGVAEKMKVYEKNGKFYLDGEDFQADRFGAGKYTVKYSYYIRNKSGEALGNPQFVTSTTKEIMVYDKDNKYYENYALELQLASEWVDNGETGVEKTLPKAVGRTTASTSPASEEVEVSYKVEVQFMAKDAHAFAALNAEKYNQSEKDKDADGGFKTIVEMENEKSYLADPSAFKPLEDGTYRFIYTITDFYGNTVSSPSAAYEYLNIIDEQNPTPIVFDASVQRAEDEKIEDESYKLKSRTAANGVIVYAIGIDDNVSTAQDSTLEREIRTSESVSKYTIKDYNDKNLVFNYRKTSSAEAWENLLTNNFLLNKDVEAFNNLPDNEQNKVENDEKMLEYLKGHGYLIVVDKANFGQIYETFGTQIKAATENAVTDATVADGETDSNGNKKAANFLKWLQDKYSETTAEGTKKTEEQLAEDRAAITNLGFAYLDAEETFGATTANGGMGATTFYIHYIATDKQGNKSDKSYTMEIGSETAAVDTESPKISFATTLQDSYNPNGTVQFSVPTASDNQDKRMKVHTFYRFLDKDNTPVKQGNDKTDLAETFEDLADLWADIDSFATTDDLVEYQNILKDYATFKNGNGGYIELAEEDAGSYSIDLSKVSNTTATSLQIFSYVYDDAGYIGVYGETVKINNSIDTIPPQVAEVEHSVKTVKHGQTIEIPEVKVYDDNVAYMNFDIKVFYKDGDVVKEDKNFSNARAERNVLNANGGGEYKVYGGKFTASYVSNYTVAITLSDSRNNNVTYFFNYVVTPKVTLGDIEVKAPSLAQETDVELGSEITLPTPSITYNKDSAITYDQLDSATESDVYVIRGIDKNGKATNWTTTYGQEGSFKPQKEGTYQIQYISHITVYNRNMFYFKELEIKNTESVYTVDGGYYVLIAEKEQASPSYKIVPLDEYKFEVTTRDGTYIVEGFEKTLPEGETQYDVKVYNAETNEEIPAKKQESENQEVDNPEYPTFVKDGTVDGWFGEIKQYNRTSTTYRVNVKDSQGPTIADYDYQPEYTVDEFKALFAEEDAGLTIYGIEATDPSGIDFDNSKIEVAWKLSNGVSSSKTYEGKDNVIDPEPFRPTANNMDQNGTYTITYTVADFTGKTSQATYTIAVGDNVPPTIKSRDGLVQSTYQVGANTKLTIDLSENAKDLIFSDNLMPEDFEFEPTVTLRNTSTNNEVEADENKLKENIYEFTLDEVGSYTLTIEITDSVGNKQTKTFTFEVVAQESEPTTVYQTVGTILIVISVLVLAGVIVYFIVSKVKLDKELKK